MNHKLLTRFVLSGMQKNRKTLIPFLIAGSITVMIFYILRSLAFCPYIYQNHVEAFYGAQTIAIILEMCSGIVGIFSAIFLFYANQFVIKGRKKEMALYGVLGMSKQNIACIMLTESLIHAFICMATGILAGTFLNKLALLILYKIIGQPPVDGILFSARTLINTLVLFAIIFVVCLIYNVSSISVGNPIQLLQSDKTGEKEPKVKKVPFITGIVTLAAGYYLAVSAQSTAEAISVSNLMFRMKHNAAGLASICVLSTGVILLLTCGCSLMMLGEKNIDDRYPTDIKVETSVSGKEEGQKELEVMRNALTAADISTADEIYRQYRTLLVVKNGERQEYISLSQVYMEMESCVDTYLLTIDDYNEYAGTNISLAEDEILIYNSDKQWRKGDTLDFLDNEYKVAGTVNYQDVYYIINPSMALFEHEILVFSSGAQLDTFMEKAGLSEDYRSYDIYMGYQLNEELSKGQMEQLVQAANTLGENFEISFKAEEKTYFYNLYGGTFFVGIFLALLFLMATVMIIYYKQMSEGFEDQKRFHILANVGLTEREARKTIQTQVMLLLFLPVGAAMVHMIVASNVIRLFLRMILIVDALTFNAAIAVVCVIFLLVYVLVYKVTSREYYKIVNAG